MVVIPEQVYCLPKLFFVQVMNQLYPRGASVISFFTVHDFAHQE
jgi:hypothetical protein